MAELKRIFQPYRLRNRDLKNRLFFAAHATGLSERGVVGDRLLAYYQARIDDGISLLMTEAHYVAGSHEARPLPTASDDRFVPGMTRLAQACHAKDALLFGQICHQSRGSRFSIDGSLDVKMAPSEIPDEQYRITPAPMTVEQILDLVHEFGATAARMQMAGVDGIELAAGGNLHGLFLSPHNNRRDDAFGGTLESRFRFLQLTLEAMRANVEAGTIIGIRLSANEAVPGGPLLEETLEVCRWLADRKLVDYINIKAGSKDTLTGISYGVAPMFIPRGYAVPAAARLREETGAPVFVVGRINQPQQAESILEDGSADMVGLVRALIADPAFIAKARADRAEDIRTCIACNQACVGHTQAGFGLSCIQYPETGRELLYQAKPLAGKQRKIAVIGGGPGGMKAATVAAQRGHDVWLVEQHRQLGGQAVLAGMLPGREEFGGLVANFESELERAGVEVELGRRVNAGDILERNPEAIILATGALPYRPSLEGDASHVYDAWDVIRGTVNVGSSVAIADWRCDWVGLGVAEKLARDGCRVMLYVCGEMAGQSLHHMTRYPWIGRLHRLGVTIVPYVRLFGFDGDTVYFQHVTSGEPVLCENIDTLVLATGHRREASLQEALLTSGADVRTIGDCLSPRTVEEAVLEGLQAGMAV